MSPEDVNANDVEGLMETRRLIMAIRSAGSIVAGLVALTLMTGVSVAQPFGGGPGWGPGMMMGPGMMGRSGYNALCNPRGAGLAEWRIDRIERAIRLTDAQRSALNELRNASAKAAEQISSACAADLPSKSSERLALMEKRLEAMLQAVKTVRPAYDAFYATLNNEQKDRLDGTGPRSWGWRGWR